VITSIALRNFKAFREIVLPLRKLTLLSGINGSGKSTVLQSLCALKQSFNAGCLSPSGGLLLNGEFVDLGVGKDVLCELSDSNEIAICIVEDESRENWLFSYAERDDLLQFAEGSLSNFNTGGWLARGFCFLGADRIAPAVVYPKSFNETVRRRSLGIRGQFTAYFLAVHQDEPVSEHRMHTAGFSSRLIDQVNAWLGEISPGVSVTAEEIGGADLTQLLYRYGGSAGIDSSNHYRPTNVGFGLTYVLPVVVACLAARDGDLVLLENPEAHLHPRGQTAMGDLVSRTANDGVQVIVESHSDHLLNGIRLAAKRRIIPAVDVQLHFCMRRDGVRSAELVSPSMDDDARLTDWPDGFFDEWERALLELT